MNVRLRNYKLIAASVAGLVILAITGSVMDSRRAAAQGPPPGTGGVTIAAPIPLPVTGTVSANQSGPWNVGVLGTPNVNIANTPTVGLAIKPFQFAQRVTIPSDQLGASTSFTVPTGKLLTIEDVSISTLQSSAGIVVACGVTTTIGGPTVNHLLTVEAQGAAGGFGQSYLCSRTTRIYASGGTTVGIGIARQLGGDGLFDVAVSGNLTDQ